MVHEHSSYRRSRPHRGQGRLVIDPLVVEAPVAASGRSRTSPLAQLTPRELEVLDHGRRGRHGEDAAGGVDRGANRLATGPRLLVDECFHVEKL
jgi:hypothetical protein